MPRSVRLPPLSALLRPLRDPGRHAVGVGAVAVLTAAALLAGDPPSTDTAAVASSTSTIGSSGAGDARLGQAQRIADALGDPSLIVPEIAASVASIDTNVAGWLLLVVPDELVDPDLPQELCSALSVAELVPPHTLVFVVDREHHLVRGC